MQDAEYHPSSSWRTRKESIFFSQSNTEYERLKKLIGQVNQLEPSENGPGPRTNLVKPMIHSQWYHLDSL